MTELQLSCAMCGREKTVAIPTDKIAGTATLESVIKQVAPSWVTQQNGYNFDIYCGKKCAQ